MSAGLGAGPGQPASADRVVFVHGIGGPRDAAEARRQWTGALARGVDLAGHNHTAALLDTATAIGIDAPVETTFAYYGDLFTTPGTQGSSTDLAPDQAAFVRDLLLELLDTHLALALPAASPEDTAQLIRAREQLVQEGTTQGAGSVARQVINAAAALLAFGPLHRAGQWAAAKMLIRELSQVTRYLARGEPDAAGRTLDERIRDRVREAIDGRPAVVVAHSLGSVVAWEALHDPVDSAPVPLLVTLGSPLSLPTVVRPRLVPRPLRTPDRVGRWLNFWDRDDLIVAQPQLADYFGANRLGVTVDSRRVDSDGLWVHTATKYLAQPAVAGPVAWALGGDARRYDHPGGRSVAAAGEPGRDER